MCANFLAEVQGSRGAVHRLGSDHIRAEASGWNSGVLVKGKRINMSSNEFDIYITGGSSGRYSPSLLGTVTGNTKDLNFKLSSQFAPPKLSLMDAVKAVIDRFTKEVDCDTEEQKKAAEALVQAFNHAEKVLYEEEYL